jgi:hypothetical protein
MKTIVKLNCPSCFDQFYYLLLDGKIYSNITFNRKNNNICHSVDNLEILCKLCNSSQK